MRFSRAALGFLAAGCATAAEPQQTTVLTLGMTTEGSTGDAATTDSGDPEDGSSSSSSGKGEAGSTSSSGPPDGSTTMPAPSEEICDGLDNDQDGLIDETSPANNECQGCQLFQLAGFAYWVCDVRLSWEDAQMQCQSRGAELASVHSDMESNAIFAVFADVDDDDTWIGLNDRDREGTYVWSDGTAFGYDNWGMGEPNDPDDDNDCVTIRAPESDWGDTRCHNVFRFACKAAHV